MFTFVLIEEMTFTKATVCLYVMLVFPLIHVRQLHELVSLRLRVICFSRKAAMQVFAEWRRVTKTTPSISTSCWRTTASVFDIHRSSPMIFTLQRSTSFPLNVDDNVIEHWHFRLRSCVLRRREGCCHTLYKCNHKMMYANSNHCAENRNLALCC